MIKNQNKYKINNEICNQNIRRLKMNKRNIFGFTLYFILLISLMLPLISQAQDSTQEPQPLGESVICKDVEENDPVFETTSFRTWDEKAVCWIRFNYQSQEPFMITWEWIDPERRFYHIGEIEMEAGNYQNYRSWYWISIRDHHAANRLGKWEVRVYINDNFLAKKDFTIE